MKQLFDVPLKPVDRSAGGYIDENNYADHLQIREAAREWPGRGFETVRSQRHTLSEMFSRFYALDRAKRRIELYRGRHRVYLPKVKQVLDTNSAHVAQELFPLTERLGIEPHGPLGEAMAPVVRRTLEHFTEESHLRTQVLAAARSFLQYGTVVVKSPWEVRTGIQIRRRPTLPENIDPSTQFDVDGQQVPRTFFAPQRAVHYEGPRAKVVDLQRWFIHPMTVESIDDAELIFEDFEVSINHLKGMAEEGYYSKRGVKELLERVNKTNGGDSDVTSRRNERAADYGFSVDDPHVPHTKFTITEAWVMFPLYKFVTHPAMDGRMDLPVPCKMVFAGFEGGGDPIPLMIAQNPYAQQRPPYRAARLDPVPDMFYGRGQSETLEYFQYILNAFVSQALDAGNYAMNQSLFVDVTKLARQASKIRLAPNSLIPTRGKPGDVVQPWAPENLSPIAFQIASVLSAWMDEDGNNHPMLRGGALSKRQSAFESAATRQGALIFIDKVVALMEGEILSPMMKDWYIMAEQWLSPESYMRINKSVQPRVADLQHLLGDYDFRWATGSGAQKREELEIAIMQQQLAQQTIQAQLMQIQAMMAQAGVVPPGGGAGSPPRAALGPGAGAPAAPSVGQVGSSAPPFLGG